MTPPYDAGVDDEDDFDFDDDDEFNVDEAKEDSLPSSDSDGDEDEDDGDDKEGMSEGLGPLHPNYLANDDAVFEEEYLDSSEDEGAEGEVQPPGREVHTQEAAGQAPLIAPTFLEPSQTIEVALPPLPEPSTFEPAMPSPPPFQPGEPGHQPLGLPPLPLLPSHRSPGLLGEGGAADMLGGPAPISVRTRARMSLIDVPIEHLEQNLDEAWCHMEEDAAEYERFLESLQIVEDLEGRGPGFTGPGFSYGDDDEDDEDFCVELNRLLADSDFPNLGNKHVWENGAPPSDAGLIIAEGSKPSRKQKADFTRQTRSQARREATALGAAVERGISTPGCVTPHHLQQIYAQVHIHTQLLSQLYAMAAKDRSVHAFAIATKAAAMLDELTATCTSHIQHRTESVLPAFTPAALGMREEQPQALEQEGLEQQEQQQDQHQQQQQHLEQQQQEQQQQLLELDMGQQQQQQQQQQHLDHQQEEQQLLQQDLDHHHHQQQLHQQQQQNKEQQQQQPQQDLDHHQQQQQQQQHNFDQQQQQQQLQQDLDRHQQQQQQQHMEQQQQQQYLREAATAAGLSSTSVQNLMSAMQLLVGSSSRGTGDGMLAEGGLSPEGAELGRVISPAWAPTNIGCVWSVLDVAPLRCTPQLYNDIQQLPFMNESPLDTLLDMDSKDAKERKSRRKKCAKVHPLAISMAHISASLHSALHASLDPTLLYRTAPVVPKHYWSPGEDQLLALGIRRFGVDWQAIQQTYLPVRSENQVFVRQKNILARHKTNAVMAAKTAVTSAPLTQEEKSKIVEGIRRFQASLDSGRETMAALNAATAAVDTLRTTPGDGPTYSDPFSSLTPHQLTRLQWEYVSDEFLPHRKFEVLQKLWSEVQNGGAPLPITGGPDHRLPFQPEPLALEQANTDQPTHELAPPPGTACTVSAAQHAVVPGYQPTADIGSMLSSHLDELSRLQGYRQLAKAAREVAADAGVAPRPKAKRRKRQGEDDEVQPLGGEDNATLYPTQAPLIGAHVEEQPLGGEGNATEFPTQAPLFVAETAYDRLWGQGGSDWDQGDPQYISQADCVNEQLNLDGRLPLLLVPGNSDNQAGMWGPTTNRQKGRTSKRQRCIPPPALHPTATTAPAPATVTAASLPLSGSGGGGGGGGLPLSSSQLMPPHTHTHTHDYLHALPHPRSQTHTYDYPHAQPQHEHELNIFAHHTDEYQAGHQGMHVEHDHGGWEQQHAGINGGGGGHAGGGGGGGGVYSGTGGSRGGGNPGEFSFVREELTESDSDDEDEEGEGHGGGGNKNGAPPVLPQSATCLPGLPTIALDAFRSPSPAGGGGAQPPNSSLLGLLSVALAASLGMRKTVPHLSMLLPSLPGSPSIRLPSIPGSPATWRPSSANNNTGAFSPFKANNNTCSTNTNNTSSIQVVRPLPLRPAVSGHLVQEVVHAVPPTSQAGIALGGLKGSQYGLPTESSSLQFAPSSSANFLPSAQLPHGPLPAQPTHALGNSLDRQAVAVDKNSNGSTPQHRTSADLTEMSGWSREEDRAILDAVLKQGCQATTFSALAGLQVWQHSHSGQQLEGRYHELAQRALKAAMENM